MSQNVYSLHPANNTVQQLSAPPVPIPSPGVGQLDADPLPEMTLKPVQLGTNQTQPEVILKPKDQEPTLTAAPTVEAPTATQALAQQTALDPVGQYYKQQLASYDNPWYKQHPIATRFLGMQQAGLPGLFAAPQIAEQMVQQNKATAMKNLQAAQEHVATNYMFRTNYNKVADALKLERMPESGAVDAKTWMDLLGHVGGQQAFNAIADVQARNRQIDEQNQIIAKEKIAFRSRLNDPGITPQEKAVLIKQGEPQFMKPIPMPAVVNQFLDMKDIAPALNANTESAKVGTEAGGKAIQNSIAEKQAEVEAAKLQNQLDYQNKTLELERSKQNQGEQHFQTESGQRQQDFELRRTDSSRKSNNDRLQGYWKEYQEAEGRVDTARKAANEADSALQKIAANYHHNQHGMVSDPGYAPALIKKRQAEAALAQAQTDSGEKLTRFHQFQKLTGEPEGSADTTPRPAAPPQAAPTGQKLHTVTPKLKGNKGTQDLFRRLGI